MRRALAWPSGGLNNYDLHRRAIGTISDPDEFCPDRALGRTLHAYRFVGPAGSRRRFRPFLHARVRPGSSILHAAGWHHRSDPALRFRYHCTMPGHRFWHRRVLHPESGLSAARHRAAQGPASPAPSPVVLTTGHLRDSISTIAALPHRQGQGWRVSRRAPDRDMMPGGKQTPASARYRSAKRRW